MKQAQTSAAYFQDFAHLAIRKPLHLEPPEPCFKNLNFFLFLCPDFNGGVGIYHNVIVSNHFVASKIPYNLIQEY